AGEIHPPQRPEGRAGAAGDRRPRLEGELVGQRHQGGCRHLEIIGMAAVAADAVGDETLFAQLRPAGAAMAAHAAAFVVMAHHALPDARLALADAWADGNDDTAGLVPGDDRSLGRA